MKYLTPNQVGQSGGPRRQKTRGAVFRLTVYQKKSKKFPFPQKKEKNKKKTWSGSALRRGGEGAMRHITRGGRRKRISVMQKRTSVTAPTWSCKGLPGNFMAGR